MSQRRTLSSCSAARRLSRCVFFSQHTHGDRPRHRTRFTRLRFQTHDLRLSRLSAHITLLRGLVFDERGASTQGQISCRVALKLQRRTELLVQRNACGLWKRLQRAALFFDPEMSFSRPRAWFILFRPSQSFFDLYLFFNPATRSRKRLRSFTNNIEEKRMRKQLPCQDVDCFRLLKRSTKYAFCFCEFPTCNSKESLESSEPVGHRTRQKKI